MSHITAIWRLALLRLRANWKLHSTVALGILTAVVLMASAPLYADILNDLGLAYTLRNEPPSRSNLQLVLGNQPLRSADFNTTDTAIRGLVGKEVGDIVGEPQRFIKTGSLFLFRTTDRIPGVGQTPNSQPRGYLQYFDGFDRALKLSSGAWPAANSGELEVVAGKAGADDLGLTPGTIVQLAPATGGPPIAARLVGLVEPVNPDDRAWNIGVARFAESARDWVIVPMFTTSAALLNLSQAGTADEVWLWTIDTGKITTANAPQAQRAITRLRSTVAAQAPGAAVVTAVDSILEGYLAKLALTVVPLFLLILQIVCLVLFYLVLAANVVVDRQAGEVAILKGRGATSWHIIGLYMTEGAVLTAGAVLIGPLLAVALCIGLLSLPGSALAGGQAPPIRPTLDIWLAALIGGGLSMAALVIPAQRAARQSVVEYRRQAGRQESVPFWQRYYLDVALLVVAAAGYWEISQQAGRSGAESIDPLLLLSPALMSLAAAAVFLRLFPLATRLASRTVGRWSSVPLQLALLEMSRRPGPYARTILLLVLTTGVGLFAATFQGTIERSYQERTLYRVGADLRVEGIASGSGRPAAEITATLSAADPSAVIAAGYRQRGAVGPTQQNRQYTFLALDAAVARSVIWSRGDFADRPLADLVESLYTQAEAINAPELPAGGEALSVWVRPTPAQPRLELFARVQDADGKLFDVALGKVDFSDWRVLEAPLPPTAEVKQPLSLRSVYLQQAGGFAEAGGGSIALDDLAIREKGGIRRIVETFDTVGAWDVLRDGAGDQNDRIDIARDTRSGTPGLRFAWSPRRTFGSRGIRAQGADAPLRVLASPGFLQTSGRQPGDTMFLAVGDRTVQVTLAGTVDYFPTMDPAETGFVIGALGPTLARLNQVPGRPIYPNEAWVKVSSSGLIDGLANAGLEKLGARSVLARDRLIGQASSDPLVAAGWSGILFLAFLTSVLLSVTGFVVQSLLSLQQRYVDFAVLRTLGLTTKQVGGLITAEYVAVVVAGIGAGTLLGLQIGSVMLPFLELTERGGRILPPFVITTNWQTVLPTYGILAVVFAVVLAGMAVAVSRLSIGRTLRIGE